MEILYAFIATIFTWAMTTLGAAMVFFNFRESKFNSLLGFAAGVMLSASFWSLLEPAVELTPKFAFIIVPLGFICGALFIYAANKIFISFQKLDDASPIDSSNKMRRVFMLIFAITLHNIPEGLAVGVAFGAVATATNKPEALASAAIVALGIGIQNFPEGAAVSLPLKRENYSKAKSFFCGQASGLVEPIAGVIGALLVMHITSILPFALSLAAGAMILVAVHELIPESQQDRAARPYAATIGIVFGFAVMMLLDLMFTS
jgi:ZIP family zinc transporter